MTTPSSAGPGSPTPRSSRPTTRIWSASTPAPCGPWPTTSSPGSRRRAPPRSSGAGADMRREVLRAVDLVRPEDAGRRVGLSQEPRSGRDVSAACGWLFSGLQVMGAGERAGRAPARRERPALHHGRLGRVHRRRRPPGDAERARLRVDAQRHLARARRARRGHRVHLAGRARHPADQHARGELLRGPSRPAPGERVGRRRQPGDVGATRGSGPRPTAGTSPTRRC